MDTRRATVNARNRGPHRRVFVVKFREMVYKTYSRRSTWTTAARVLWGMVKRLGREQ